MNKKTKKFITFLFFFIALCFDCLYGQHNMPQARKESFDSAELLNVITHIPEIQKLVVDYLNNGWDWSLRTVIKTNNNAVLITYFPDNQHIACASPLGTIDIWDIKKKVINKTVNTYTAMQEQTRSMLAADNIFITVSNLGKISIWDISAIHSMSDQPFFIASYQSEFPKNKPSKNSLAYSSQEKLLALSILPSVITILSLKNLKNITEHRVLNCNQNEASEISFSPCGKYLATAGASSNNAVHIWDLERGNRIKSVELLPRLFLNIIETMRWLSDNILIASKDDTIYKWDVSNPHKPQQLVSLTDQTSESYNGSFTTFGSADYEKKIEQLVNVPHSSKLISMTHSPRTQELIIWDERGQKKQFFNFTEGKIHDIAISPNGQYFASSCSDLTIKIWENQLILLSAHYFARLHAKKKNDQVIAA